jgi:hypothetical protein
MGSRNTIKLGVGELFVGIDWGPATISSARSMPAKAATPSPPEP